MRRELRAVGIAASVGIMTGILIGGVTSRLAMRAIAATSDPRLDGVLTSDSEPVGEITLGGTIGLVMFVGVFGGVVLGLGYLVLRGLLPSDLRLRAACWAVVVWCVGGATMFDSADFDFRTLEPGWLSVLMFSAIFLAAGWVVAAGIEVALRSWPSGDRGSWWRYAPLVLLLPFFPFIAVLLVVALVRSAALPARPGRVASIGVLAGRALLVAGALALGLPTIGEVIEIV